MENVTTQALPVEELVIEELTEAGASNCFGTAGSIGCPVCFGTYGCAT
ncbi:thiocillin family RiPP [Amycolatopsis rhabdoformis]|uniref:Thiocillin family RiPP n=1 Tax=Amycolatopsis rhabdoformis TaxID=1448059 RepID=A0ABZ1I4R0_9PSEU|nr:thiocillin family RiPP [Amycolatopsis rhabdoformis]WSE28459.1 thiocillin family RiPP [Amycolatopsis rhabdoformis]